MYRSLGAFFGTVIATLTSAIGMANAQMSPLQNVAHNTAGRRPSIANPGIAGSWSGTVIQIQRSIEYTVTLEISSQDAQVSYPELRCGGRLSRVGMAGGYFFFAETITRGPVDNTGRCSNGTITVTRAGDNLAWGWFGLVKGEVVAAYGTLKRKSDSLLSDSAKNILQRPLATMPVE